MSAFLAEVIGTAFILLFGCGVVASVLLNKSKGNGAGYLAITIGWGLAVMLGVYASGQFSGAHLNPAVTLGLAVAGKFPWEKVPMYILAQFLGAMLGSTITYLAYYPHWEETSDPGLKLAVFSTGPAIKHTPSNFLCEFIATFALLFTIMVIGANKYSEGLGPVIVGLLIVALGLSLGGPTGWAMNPARDLGPRIMHAILPIKGKGESDWGYAWIPVVAPVLGGICGTLTAVAMFGK